MLRRRRWREGQGEIEELKQGGLTMTMTAQLRRPCVYGRCIRFKRFQTFELFAELHCFAKRFSFKHACSCTDEIVRERAAVINIR